MENNWERLGKAHLELTRRRGKDHICKTSARQLGGKWGTTSERSERQLGNNRATNGRHVEIIGRPILGNKSGLSKVSIWGQFWDHISGDKRQTTRQHMEKPWRKLDDSIRETTYARQLRGHIYLGERWKTTEEQQEWETTPQKPHLGDNWETASGKEVEDNETTTRPGANIWETKSRRQLRDHMWEIGQRQLNNNRTGKQQLETTWPTKQLPDQGPISGKPNLGDNWETICGR